MTTMEAMDMLARWLEVVGCCIESVDPQEGVQARSEEGIPFWCTVMGVETGGMAEVKAHAWAALYHVRDTGVRDPGALWEMANAVMQEHFVSVYLDEEDGLRVEWTNVVGESDMGAFLAATLHFIQALESLEGHPSFSGLLRRSV